MPPGPNYRRKDSKKKKKKKNTAVKTNKKSLSSIQPTDSSNGESDGGQVSSSHMAVNVEKSEDSMSGQESFTTENTQKVARETQGKNEIDSGSSSQKPHEKKLNSRSSSSDNKSRVKKNAALSESVADYLCKPIEDLASQTPPIGDPVKTVDQEMASNLQLNKSTKLQKENDFVVPETPLEQTIFNENVLKNNPLSKENEVQKLASDQKDSPQSKNSLLPDSTIVKCPYCGKSSDDRVDELETPECSERQPLLASAPHVSEKSSWKSCCGIFELFSNGRK